MKPGQRRRLRTASIHGSIEGVDETLRAGPARVVDRIGAQNHHKLTEDLMIKNTIDLVIKVKKPDLILRTSDNIVVKKTKMVRPSLPVA